MILLWICILFGLITVSNIVMYFFYGRREINCYNAFIDSKRDSIALLGKRNVYAIAEIEKIKSDIMRYGKNIDVGKTLKQLDLKMNVVNNMALNAVHDSEEFKKLIRRVDGLNNSFCELESKIPKKDMKEKQKRGRPRKQDTS